MFAVRALTRRLRFAAAPRFYAINRGPVPPVAAQSCDINTGKCTPLSPQQQAYSEMTKVEQFIFDVKSIGDWTEKVMKSKVPVVLQFHADWCNPCRRLMPLLEKATMQGAGKWALAKVDIDEMQSLAQALKVGVVPTVYLVHRGQAIHKVEGAPDEEGLKKFFEDVKLLAGLASEEDAIKGLHAAGEEFLAKGEWDNAIHSFEEILKHGKWKSKYELSCFLHLAQAYKGKADLSASEALVAKLKAGFAQELQVNAEASRIVAEVEQWTKSQTMDAGFREYQAAAQRLETEAKNSPTSSTYCRLAELHLKHGKSKEAIDSALAAIEIDKSFKGEGQAALISVFKALGQNHELVKEARKRVQRLHAKFTV